MKNEKNKAFLLNMITGWKASMGGKDKFMAIKQKKRKIRDKKKREQLFNVKKQRICNINSSFAPKLRI